MDGRPKGRLYLAVGVAAGLSIFGVWLAGQHVSRSSEREEETPAESVETAVVESKHAEGPLATPELAAAIVGEERVLVADLNADLDRAIAAAKRRSQGVDRVWIETKRGELLQRRIERLLLSLHFEARGVIIGRGALDEELTRRHGSADRRKLERFAAAAGQTVADLVEDVRFDLQLEATLGQRDRLEPTEEELRATYRALEDAVMAPRRMVMDLIRLPQDSDGPALLIDVAAATDLSEWAASVGAHEVCSDEARTRASLSDQLGERVFALEPSAEWQLVEAERAQWLVRVHGEETRGKLAFEEVRELVLVRARRNLHEGAMKRLLDEIGAATSVETLDRDWHRRLQRRLQWTRAAE